MNMYKVTVTETLSKTIIVEAEDKNDAYNKVLDAVDAEIVMLTADDYQHDSRVICVGGKAKGYDFYCYDNLEEIEGYNEIIDDYMRW